MKRKEKINHMMEWFSSLNDEKKNQVANHLFEYAFDSEYINIRSEEDAKEIAEAEGEPAETYLGPYFTSCGESLTEVFEGR